MGDVQYEQLPTFDLKRGNAQNKHSLPTRRATTTTNSGYANNPLNIDDSSAVVGYGDSATITT